MDYRKLLRSLSKRAVYSYRCYIRCAAVVSAALLVGLPLGAHASVLKINPGDDAGNVINLSGELSASITHTAEGMTIEIPGVEISLVCNTNTDPDNCTVTVGSGSAAATQSTPGRDTTTTTTTTTTTDTSDTSDTSDTTTASNAGDSCDPAFDFGCQDGALGGASVASASDDTSDTGNTSETGGSTGFTSPTTSSSGDDDPCSGTGFKPACVSDGTDSSVAIDGAPFPIGSDRRVNVAGGYNLGSASSPSKERIDVPAGSVTAVGLTMASGNSLSAGRIVFATGSNINGVTFRGWISKSADGPAVSAACTYVGYPEGVLRFDINGGGDCSLSAGGDYYFNMALCVSSAFDVYCNAPNARASTQQDVIVVTANYSS